jgi:hypothetical protein
MSKERLAGRGIPRSKVHGVEVLQTARSFSPTIAARTADGVRKCASPKRVLHEANSQAVQVLKSVRRVSREPVLVLSSPE